MAAILILGLMVADNAAEIAVIELRHRPAAELIPLLQPLLEPHDSLTPNHAQLIITASPATINSVRALLDRIDLRPHRVRITVTQDGQLTADTLNGGITAGGENRHGVAVPGRLSASNARERKAASTFVQTLDGQPAMIEVGQAVPLRYSQADGSGVTYQPVTTGFAVTPRLTGEREVRVTIEPWSDRLNPDGRIGAQSAATRLLAPLGTWVEVGGLAQTSTTQGYGPARSGLGHREHITRIFLKVDDLDAGPR